MLPCMGLQCTDHCAVHVSTTQLQTVAISQSTKNELRAAVLIPAAAARCCPTGGCCSAKTGMQSNGHTHATYLGNAPKNSCPQPSSVSISEKAVRMRSEMCDDIAPIVNVTARKAETAI
jgi:hypothetical protein